MGKIILTLIILSALSCKVNKKESTKCDCDKVIEEFTYVEGRYELSVFCPKKVAVHYDNGRSNTEVNKHIDLLRLSTKINFGKSDIDLCYTLSNRDIDTLRKWIQQNCSKQYQHSYHPIEKNIGYQLKFLEKMILDWRLSEKEYRIVKSEAEVFIKGEKFMEYNSGKHFFCEMDEVVLFNTSFNKALLFVNKKDTINGEGFGFTDILFASKELDKWSFSVLKENIKLEIIANPSVNPELQSSVFKNSIEGGYFVPGTCIVNNNYLDSIEVIVKR